MNNISKGLFLLSVISIMFFLMGCVEEDMSDNGFDDELIVKDNNIQNNDERVFNDSTQKQTVAGEIDSADGFLDCGNSLDCLIQAVRDEKQVKAIIENVFTSESGKQYVNQDYLRVKEYEGDFELYRRNEIIMGFLVEELIDGKCYFSKDELISFLEKWDTKIFEVDYYEKYSCEGISFGDNSQDELGDEFE